MGETKPKILSTVLGVYSWEGFPGNEIGILTIRW